MCVREYDINTIKALQNTRMKRSGLKKLSQRTIFKNQMESPLMIKMMCPRNKTKTLRNWQEKPEVKKVECKLLTNMETLSNVIMDSPHLGFQMII